MTDHDPYRQSRVRTDVEVLARAAAGGYAMVGPSARTWSVDPATGVPAGPVSEAEHRQVRDLIARELLDGAEPVWLRCADGGDEIVAAVVPSEGRDGGPDPDLHPDLHPDLDVTRAGSGGYPNCLREIDDGDPVGVPEMPAQMREGLEQRRTEPAERDDPGELYARLADLRARVAVASDDPTGTPPGGWQTVGREQAARELTTRGADQGVGLDAARSMVTDYLDDTAEQAGLPGWLWGLDQGDLDAIAAQHHLPTCLTGWADRHTDHEADQDGDDAGDADDVGWPQ